jgi:hypothetical protein
MHFAICFASSGSTGLPPDALRDSQIAVAISVITW